MNCFRSTSTRYDRMCRLVVCLGLLSGLATLSACNSNDDGDDATQHAGNPPPTASAVYVATDGDDSAQGTQADPWRTIQHAVDRATGGGKIWVRSGTYHEAVVVTRSGSPDNYLVIGSYPGEQAVLDGQRVSIADGQAGLVTIEDQDYVRIQGLEIRNYQSTNDDVPIGILVAGRGDHIELRGNHIHDIVTRQTGCEGNALGIAIYGSNGAEPQDHIVIAGNEVDHLQTGCSESIALNGNVTHFRVTDNTIHDNNNIGIDAIGFEGTSPDPATDQARNGVISDNTIYNISSAANPAYEPGDYGADGIYVDGGRDIIVERNRVHDVDIGMEFASEHADRNTTGVTARSNLVYNNHTAGISIGGYSDDVGGTQNCAIVNNTFYHNDTEQTGSGEFQIQYAAQNNRFQNNIVVAGDDGLLINDVYGDRRDPARLDTNLFYAENGSLYVWRGEEYEGLDAFRRASGTDAGSVEAVPLFVKTGDDSDFAPQPGSPAINSGLTLAADLIGDRDFTGKDRVREGSVDIGANEF